MQKFVSFLTGIGIFGSSALAFADGAEGSGGGNYSMLIMLALAIGAFYFIILRPERKRRREMQDRLGGMKKGDRVTAAMGIRGTVHKVETDSVIIKLYDGAKMELLKQAVTDVQAGSGAEPELVETK